MNLKYVNQHYRHVEHLGDGAYVAMNDYELIIFTSDGIEVLNIVVLEPPVAMGLAKYMVSKGIKV
jgi:hypothetical protein